MRSGVKTELKTWRKRLPCCWTEVGHLIPSLPQKLFLLPLLDYLLCSSWVTVGPCNEELKVPTRSGMFPGTWQHRMKLQLFLKASKAYYVLSDAATNLLKYGRALRYIKLALQCHGKNTLLSVLSGNFRAYTDIQTFGVVKS